MGLYRLANCLGLLSVMDADGTVFGGKTGDGVQKKPTFYKMPAEPQPPAPGAQQGGHYISGLVSEWERQAARH